MIITDDLDEYVALKGLINHCSYTYESDTCCQNCKLKEICSVALGCSTFQNFKVKYEPYYDVSKAAPRDLEAKTLDEWKKDGDKVELTF
jgi:hypothetical protein